MKFNRTGKSVFMMKYNFNIKQKNCICISLMLTYNDKLFPNKTLVYKNHQVNGHFREYLLYELTFYKTFLIQKQSVYDSIQLVCIDISRPSYFLKHSQNIHLYADTVFVFVIFFLQAGCNCVNEVCLGQRVNARVFTSTIELHECDQLKPCLTLPYNSFDLFTVFCKSSYNLDVTAILSEMYFQLCE